MIYLCKGAVLRILSLILLVAIVYGVFSFFSNLAHKVLMLDTDLAVGIVSATSAIIIATLSIVFGRFFERKKEIDSHFRERKVEFYDDFLKEFFNLFHKENGENNNEPDQELVIFLREWQRKLMLWGGPSALSSYIEWISLLKKGEANAEVMYLTEDFFFAIRKDLGLSNWGLKKGSFVKLILQNPELFMKLAEKNPKITLAEIAEIENKLSIEKA